MAFLFSFSHLPASRIRRSEPIVDILECYVVVVLITYYHAKFRAPLAF